MHRTIAKLIIASMLFVSMDGVADSLDDFSLHQANHTHADDGGAQWFPDSEGATDDGNSGEHFCHAHVFGPTTQVMLADVPHSRNYLIAPPAQPVTYDVAPPTPPPNI